MGDVKGRVLELLEAADEASLLAVEGLLRSRAELQEKESKPAAEEKPSEDQVQEDKLRAVFQRFDLDKSGTLTANELLALLQDLNPSLWDSKRVQRLLNTMDVNKDGHVSYEEFCRWVCGTDASFQRYRFNEALKSVDPSLALPYMPG
mmetsp:Transcript_34656/g.62886  ORF Transcript_34656/g.62886 Transcript_34656/m.62886 type:complete len:148 (-) Transcript_34656:111-554(-)